MSREIRRKVVSWRRKRNTVSVILIFWGIFYLVTNYLWKHHDTYDTIQTNMRIVALVILSAFLTWIIQGFLNSLGNVKKFFINRFKDIKDYYNAEDVL